MEKKPFVTKEQLDKIVEKYPTPFHLYDEKGIRQTARDLYKAFSWNEGFKEYFAVKATPTPAIAISPLSILPINILSTMLYKTLTS